MTATTTAEAGALTLEVETSDTARSVPVVQQTGAVAMNSPAGLMMAAKASGMSLADMREVLALQREWDADQGSKAFAAAMAEFKKESIRVIRNITIKDGPLKGKKHADLFAITDACVEAMAKHGLSHTFRPVETTQTWIKIACCIHHSAGHTKEIEFDGPVDTGPGRNAIQARKSSVIYLERITLLMALGLSESDADDDGRTGGGAPEVDVSAVGNALCDSLLARLEKTATDKEAADLWAEGSKALADAKRQDLYAEFKDCVVKHRTALKKGAHA